MRRWSLSATAMLVGATLAVGSDPACRAVEPGPVEVCAQRNWITAAESRVGGAATGVGIGLHRTEFAGPSWQPSRPGPTGGGSWRSNGPTGTATAAMGLGGVDLAHVAGTFEGVLESVAVIVHVQTPSWPSMQELRMQLEVDGVMLHDHHAVEVRPWAPVVDGTRVLFFAFVDLVAALEERGMPNDASVQHAIRVSFGPASLEEHVYFWDTFQTPSEVSFNLLPEDLQRSTIVRSR